MLVSDMDLGLKLDVSPCYQRELRAIPCYYSCGFAGIPHPPFVTPSWRLLLIQPSQALANFAPIAVVLILKLRFVFHPALREV